MGLYWRGLFFAGGAVVVAILNDWRRGLYILLGWIVFEDLVRKYLGNNMAIFFWERFSSPGIVSFLFCGKAQKARSAVYATFF